MWRITQHPQLTAFCTFSSPDPWLSVLHFVCLGICRMLHQFRLLMEVVDFMLQGAESWMQLAGRQQNTNYTEWSKSTPICSWFVIYMLLSCNLSVDWSFGLVWLLLNCHVVFHFVILLHQWHCHGGKGESAPNLFRPNFQIRANLVRNLKGVGVGVMISGVSQA